MLRILLATVLGGVVFFAWGALAWMVLQLHDDTMHEIDNEDRVMQVLREEIKHPGVYWFPKWPEGMMEAKGEQREDLRQQWLPRHIEGPVGLMNVHPTGFEPMTQLTFVNGFGLNLVMALLGSILLAMASLRSYVLRVLFVASIGLIVGVSTHMMEWNWMHFPLDYSVMKLVDNVIGWSAAGVVMAAVVRPRAKTQE